MYDFERLFKDHDIHTTTEGKNTQKGWINIQCPLCDDSSNHGGFNIEKGYYNCWQCGWHLIEEIIAALLNIEYPQARKLLRSYKQDTEIKETEKIERKSFLRLPTECRELTSRHWTYLMDRGFKPKLLIPEYKLKATIHLGRYKWRIIAPIYFNGKLVSFQGRDITDESTLRYKACRKVDEVVDHKNILYNIDNATGDKVVVVEGITDVWRLGRGSVATFGTSYTPQQYLLIKKRFKEAFIMFDSEPEAQKRAKQFIKHLTVLGVKAHNIKLTQGIKDAAALTQKDADEIMKELLVKKN